VTATQDITTTIPELDGGAELRHVDIGWRFISLQHINADKELPAAMRDAQLHSRRFQRVCAAARARIGNGAVGER